MLFSLPPRFAINNLPLLKTTSHAKFCSKPIAPIVRSLPSYVKDSQHAIRIFRDSNFLGDDKLIFGMVSTILYTVIPNGEGLLALKHSFDLRTVKEPSSETLLRLAELVVTPNFFSFADSYYKQINGVATGTKIGPSYAIRSVISATSSSGEDINQLITAHGIKERFLFNLSIILLFFHVTIHQPIA